MSKKSQQSILDCIPQGFGEQLQPELGCEESGVILDLDSPELLPGSLSLGPGALGAEALLLRIGTLKQVVPELDEKPTVVRLVHQGLGMVAVVLGKEAEKNIQRRYRLTIAICLSCVDSGVRT